MENEKTLEILKQTKADPKARELFAGMEKPKSLDEMISAYVQVAEKLGYNITAENIMGVVRSVPKKGFGYIALDKGRVCAVAFSAAVSSDEIDIGVETHEDCRRKGLAAILVNNMCKHIAEIGKRPVWAHAVSNIGSMNTALKCGFVQEKINTMIKGI